jgi:hypothetical protein
LRIPSRSIRDFSIFLCIVTLRPVLLQYVFLQPIQSVGTLTFFTKDRILLTHISQVFTLNFKCLVLLSS